MEFLVILLMSTCSWASPHALMQCTSLTKLCFKFLVVLERTKCYRYNPIVIVQCSERVPWDAWKHRLYALGVEELFICLTKAIYWTCWIAHNHTWSFGITKSPLHIRPNTLLFFCKLGPPFSSGIGNCLHTCIPMRIYTISQVVLLGVLMATDLIIDIRRIAFRKPREHHIA